MAGARVVRTLVLPCVCLHSIAAPPRPVTGAPRMGLGAAHSQRPGRDTVWNRTLKQPESLIPSGVE